MDHIHGGAIPVDRRRPARHYRAMHLQAAVLAHVSQFIKVAFEYCRSGEIQVHRVRRDPAFIEGGGMLAQLHALAGSGGFGFCRRHRDHHFQGPVIGTGYLLCKGVRTRAHLHEPAVDRTRGRTGALPGKLRYFPGLQTQTQQLADADCQGRESRGARRQTCTGGKVIAGLDTKMLRTTERSTDFLQEFARPRYGGSTVDAIDADLIGSPGLDFDRCSGGEALEPDRNGADRRYIACRIGFPPIFHQSDICAGPDMQLVH